MMSELIEYHMKPQGKVLEEYSDCRESNSFIMGPLGSGKTIQTCLKIFDLMCDQQPVKSPDHKNYNVRLSRWAAVRNTYSELATTTIKDWLECHGDLGRFREGGQKPPHQILSFDLEDGTRVYSEIYFIAFDRPEHVKKARGLQLTGVWLNEIKELSKSVVDMLDLRIGRYPSNKEGVTPSWYGMIGDTNAPDEDHWYYKLAEEEKPEGWEFHRQPGGVVQVGDSWEINPNAENIDNLPPNYYKRGMSGKSKDWIKVNLGNEYGFVADGKPVYPEYVDSVHCMTEEYKPDPNLPIRLGFDFGRTPACSFIQYLPGPGRYIGLDEFLSDNMSANSFAPELKRYLDQNYRGFKFEVGSGDPTGGDGNQSTDETPFMILRKHGILANGAETNDPLVRRASVIDNLKRLCMDGKPGFMISPKCKRWRKGLNGGFCYKRVQVSGDEKYKDEPDKNMYSHICEAGEYDLMGYGEGRKAIRPAKPPELKPAQASMGFDVFS